MAPAISRVTEAHTAALNPSLIRWGPEMEDMRATQVIATEILTEWGAWSLAYKNDVGALWRITFVGQSPFLISKV